MGGDDFGGGLWILVVLNSVIFIAFAASFFRPRTRRDWRVMGAWQWPTLLTLAMFPVLTLAYGRLARSEEREIRAEFGAEYEAWAARTPRFIPRPGAKQLPQAR